MAVVQLAQPETAQPPQATRSAAELEAESAQILQPSVRTYRTWTPADIRAAEISADSGYLRGAVDICEWLLADDKVRGALDGRINGLLGLPLSFEASGDKRRSKRPIKALEVEEDWFTAVPDHAAKQVLYWALTLGLGPGFNRWSKRKDHGNRDVPVLNFFHPQPICFDWNTRLWSYRDDRGNQRVIHFGDGVWVGHMPYGSYRPWSMGLWRGLARWALLKQYAISDMGCAGEAAQKNVVEIDKDSQQKVEASRDQRKQLADDLRKLGRDGNVILPPGWHYKLVELSASTPALYKQQIEMADTAIAIAIRGGNLSTNVQGGSKAAAEVQERTGDAANRKQDAGAWTETAHDQILTPWAGSNFGDPDLAPWPVYDTTPPEDKKQATEVLDSLGKAIQSLTQAGANVDIEALAERFNVPIEKTDTERGKGQLFQYHFTFGVITKNEARARLGLPPVEGGDEPAEPVFDPGGDGDGDSAQAVGGISEDVGVLPPEKRDGTPIVSRLAGVRRAVIVGGPRSGKSTVSVRAGERYRLPTKHADALVGQLSWSEMSSEVARWFDDDGSWIVEGVSTVRALRKWLRRNPDTKLEAAVVWLSGAIQRRTKRQRAMAKGVTTVWNQIRPELERRGVTIIERDSE